MPTNYVVRISMVSSFYEVSHQFILNCHISPLFGTLYKSVMNMVRPEIQEDRCSSFSALWLTVHRQTCYFPSTTTRYSSSFVTKVGLKTRNFCLFPSLCLLHALLCNFFLEISSLRCLCQPEVLAIHNTLLTFSHAWCLSWIRVPLNIKYHFLSAIQWCSFYVSLQVHFRPIRWQWVVQRTGRFPLFLRSPLSRLCNQSSQYILWSLQTIEQ